MATFDGYIGRVGVVVGPEPAGRLSVIDPADGSTVLATVSCDSGAALEVAIAARQMGQLTRVNTGTTTAPNFVATSVQLL